MAITIPRHTHRSGENALQRGSIESRQLARRRLGALAVLGAIVAPGLIALGAPVIGLGVCIATLVPLIVSV
ncbi:Flp pilus assembly protein TadG [Paraburkholderia bannensis]|jgi:Flp pilus assembly protein TadG|uniref:Flp pilus assembly protein TadG n=1 Tax=Paraburkholderia bannensis TaxID=765414 RepID=A0A7W9WTI1_9BURK|nr:MULTISPECIES: hypothetical protein [Paraburkholderia]MBB3258606.1 Flp pilus assembly protein TadG [Paraburkholderia sp. WP4_3_2]MBB6103619.1 Flp pilus assembly protein TadG [Paraburkholderia bannensis]